MLMTHSSTGKWDRANIQYHCSYAQNASFVGFGSVKSIFVKSKLMGIGFSNDEVRAQLTLLGVSTFVHSDLLSWSQGCIPLGIVLLLYYRKFVPSFCSHRMARTFIVEILLPFVGDVTRLRESGDGTHAVAAGNTNGMELKDNIVVAMPKITGKGFYTCNIHVEYEWKPSRCAYCKVFGHFQEECPKNIGVGERKNLKKPSQTPKGVPVGQSTTLIIEKIDKIEELIINGKVTFVDDKRNPLEKVVSLGDYNSEDEVASVDNEMANFFARKDGYGTNSLLEQYKDSYENGDYDYNPYDNDMYEGQEFSDKLQSICDNLDIKVRGRKKK
ncbi:zinc knuckle CX2CX4HX4C containing protein [Tanacetum coccineum]|uniref:Zinc knuckle CX2CX4HX4C containing protein n=1 Tax=Tanacetum coccineum TaxID=301880 RepID=A0ABQ5ISV3_9ASTR